MDDPKRQAWFYLGAGVVAVIAGPYFLLTGSADDPLRLIDWSILAMGIVALYRGAKGFYDLRKAGPKDSSPNDPS